MNQSLKSILAFLILVLLASSILGWATRGIGGVPGSQFWMRASTVLLVPAVALLVWADFRRDRAPDFLKRRAGRYFEQDGFCFSVLPSAEDGHFSWQVLFQNRYERPCKALVSFRPATRFVGFGRADLDDVQIEIACEGGAFGVAIIPYGISDKLQGKQQAFELIAISQFPAGKGQMLRFRDGKSVGENHKSAADLALTALSALALHAHFKKSATFKVRLPQNVSCEAIGACSQKTLWRPGDQALLDHS